MKNTPQSHEIIHFKWVNCMTHELQFNKDVKKINNSDIKKWWKTTEHFFSNEANWEDLHM